MLASKAEAVFRWQVTMAKRTTTSDRFADDVLKSLLVLSRAVDQVLETNAAESANGGPLALSRMRVLMFLGHGGGQTATRVARFLGVSKPAVTQIIDAMDNSGLVRRRMGSNDRREVKLNLTPAGRRLFEAVRRKQLQLVRVALEVSKNRDTRRWPHILREAARSLALADHAFGSFCLQCGAHADGTCVLQGGGATCLLRQSDADGPITKSTGRRQTKA